MDPGVHSFPQNCLFDIYYRRLGSEESVSIFYPLKYLYGIEFICPFSPVQNLLCYQMSPGTVTSRWMSFLCRANDGCLPWRQPLGGVSGAWQLRRFAGDACVLRVLLELCSSRDWNRHLDFGGFGCTVIRWTRVLSSSPETSMETHMPTASSVAYLYVSCPSNLPRILTGPFHFNQKNPNSRGTFKHQLACVTISSTDVWGEKMK